jgi:hypothetical protein
VANVMRLALDLEDPEAIRLALDLCEYGAHLSPQFKLRGEPPFEDIYLDYAICLRALVGEKSDDAIAPFRGKIAPDDPAPLRRWWICWSGCGATGRHSRFRSNN